jgi:hypothetical protein
VPVLQLDNSNGGSWFGLPDLLGRAELGAGCLARLGRLPTTLQGV